MIRIDNLVSVVQETKSQIVPKPQTTQTAEEAQPIVNTEKVNQMHTTANNLRSNLEDKLKINPEQQAKDAAKQVSDALYQKPSISLLGIGKVTIPIPAKSPEAAAAKLREVISKQSPEVAALTLKYSKDTIKEIVNELGNTSKEIEDLKRKQLANVSSPMRISDTSVSDEIAEKHERIENIVRDLSAAAGKASQAENGAEAVAEIAKPIAEAIAAEGGDNIASAFGRAIENGDGAKLGLEVVNQLNAAGKTDEANAVLESIEQGVDALQSKIEKTSEAVAEKASELNWLVKQWEPLMSPDELTKAIEGFKKENPEFTENLEKLNQYGADALKVIGELGTLPSSISSLDKAGDLTESVKKFASNEMTQNVVKTSTLAQEEASRQLFAADKGKSFFENIGTVAANVDGGKGLAEATLNFAVKSAVESAVDARKAKDFAKVESILGSLKESAHLLGFNHPSLDRAITHLNRITRAENEEEVRKGLRSLRDNLNALHDEGVFSDESRLSSTFKGAGLVLGAVGLGQTLADIKKDPNFENIARGLTDAVGLSSDVAQTKIAENLLKNKEWYKGLPFETAGKALGGVGLALDAVSIISDLKNGNYVDAGLSATSAVGGATLLFGSTAAASGIGAVLIGVGMAGKLIYDDFKEANKNETDSARKFLQGAGINADLANELINNDGDGNSPAPVFTALAKQNGVDPKEFFKYLSTLSPDRAKELVEKAHGVDPDDEGNYPIEKSNMKIVPRAVIKDPNPNDLTDLAEWMRENGYEGAPGI